ncbi:helix-turn-helix transcriptional regulator [Crenalkalicoccus roseus]|uniref:helix-turn-helix transcriptional regulator n=1 Tax=Crenalkalicoccus roseus TaxID=1485588 RepID=UPI00108218AF|nr:helix-turn-helix transcriptional regulator [Crenalkalicoccus roseus]
MPADRSPSPARDGEAGEAGSAPVLARFILDGHECDIVPLAEDVGAPDGLAGTLTLAGRRYGVVCTPHEDRPDPLTRLSPREFEIAALIACGCSDKEVARRLGISSHTVGAHIARCFAKLGLHKRAELAASVARRAQPRR